MEALSKVWESFLKVYESCSPLGKLLAIVGGVACILWIIFLLVTAYRGIFLNEDQGIDIDL